MEATAKAPAIENLLTHFSGVNRVETIRANKCTTCPGDALEFRDKLSEKEYTISGMCQKCQDKIFGA